MLSRGGHCCLVGSSFRTNTEDRLLRPVTARRAWRPRNAPHSTGWQEHPVAASGQGVGAACGREGSTPEQSQGYTTLGLLPAP